LPPKKSLCSLGLKRLKGDSSNHSVLWADLAPSLVRGLGPVFKTVPWHWWDQNTNDLRLIYEEGWEGVLTPLLKKNDTMMIMYSQY
jgi:hypothetical protein